MRRPFEREEAGNRDMEAAFKLAGAAFAVLLAALLLKQAKSDFFTLVGIAAAASAGIYAVAVMSGLLGEWIVAVSGFGTGGEAIGTAMKITGICLVCDFTSGCCRESGLTALAGNVELVGKLGIAAVVFPLAVSLLEMLKTILL